jgi:type I restriction enzyme S subunit
MSRIDGLIAALCPAGVEYLPIQEIFDIRNGYTPSKANESFWSDGDIPWFRMEDIRENGAVLSQAIQRIPVHAVKGGRLFPENSLLVATSATIGVHALITTPHLSNQRFTSLSLKDSFSSAFDMKFIYYYAFKLDEWCVSNSTVSSFASVDMSGFRKFRFPVPPLEIQQEIVRILDQFTELETELEAELEARRKQYEHYRSQILALSHEQLPQVKLSELTLPVPKINWKNSGEADFEYVDLSSVNRHTHHIGETQTINAQNAPSRAQQIILEGDVLFATTRPAQMRWTTIASDFDGQIASTGFCVLRPDKNRVVTNYLAHVLGASKFRDYIEANQIEGNYPSIPDNILRKFELPLPPIEEQKRIAKILDRFEAIGTDMEVGLPAEIEARRKQYEYYRDKLLKFPEAAA